MNVAPHRHHRFLGNRAFVLDGMLTDARESGLGFVGGDRKLQVGQQRSDSGKL